MTSPSPSSGSAPASTIVPGNRPVESWPKRIFSFLGWILSGFGLFTRFRKSGHSRTEEVVVYTVHHSFYLWALVLIGFVGGSMVRHWPESSVIWGWIYLWVLLYTLITLVYDMSTFKFLLWVGIFSFIWLASRYLEDMKQVPIVTGFFRYFASLRPELSAGFATVMSWILLPAWIGSLFATFSRGRKTFSPNSIEEWYMGEGSEITDRAGLKFRTRYRDIFELVLGMGAGDLEAVDGNARVVKRWPNILFLAFTWPRLDEILHQRAAVVDNSPDDPMEVHQVPAGRPPTAE